MTRRFVAVAWALVLALCTAGCATGGDSAAGAAAGASLEQKVLPMRIQREKEGEVDEQEISLYFADGSDIPYVSLSEYLAFVGSLYEYDDTPAVEYELDVDGTRATITRTDNASYMVVDTADSTIAFDNYDAFVQAPGNDTLMALAATDGTYEGGTSLFKASSSSYDRPGSPVGIELSKYGIEPILAGGECYLPLATVNDLLVNVLYTQVVYDGQEVLAGAYESELLDERLKGETGELSGELAHFNFYELCLLLDTFYGLKDEHGVTSFAELLVDTGLADYMTSGDPAEFDEALEILTNVYLDDSHSAFLGASCLTGNGSDNDEDATDVEDATDAEDTAGSKDEDASKDDADTSAKLTDEELVDLLEEAVDAVMGDADGAETVTGASSGGLEAAITDYKAVREQYLPDLGDDDVYDYREVGDTAFVTFDSFYMGREDYYASDEDVSALGDTIELISYAHEQITREGSPVKNVVIDLSCNTGGMSEAAAFTISWFLGDGKMALRNTYTGAQSVCAYEADINLDGEFDDADRLPGDLNLYCLTSPVSFSCGNLVPAAFSQSHRVTLLGRRTGGGSCIVLPATSASGALFQISGPQQISTMMNGSFYNTDAGIRPDFTLSRLETYYDRERLVDYVHDLS